MNQSTILKVDHQYSIVASIAVVLLLLIMQFAAAASKVALAADASPSPSAAATAAVTPQPPDEMGTLVAAGRLPGLRWPNFSDVQTDAAEFYAAGGNTLAWSKDERPTAQALAMIQLFKQASLKGLNPDDYDATRWDNRLAAFGSSSSSPGDGDPVHFDLALSVCAARYLSALHIGRVDPQHSKFGFAAGPRTYDLAEFLRNQVIEAPDVAAAAASLEPRYDGYERAKTALAAYLALAAQGDGAALPLPSKSVRPGDNYAAIAPLVARLRELGDLPADTSVAAGTVAARTSIYQGAPVDAVRRFQKRHGLQPDGVLGKETIGQLNVPLSQRVKQLQYTLERYRWIPPSFPQPPIVVNIPEFRLRTMRRQPAPFLSMRVVVGKAYGHQTPVFADYMRYLIFRPYWNVPMSIQFAELVPKTRLDRNYLADHGFEVTTSKGVVVTDGPVSDDVLNQLSSGSLSIRQKPGPKNALGLVKFIFPNHYNVYLHSTPVPELFLKPRRDFSHGCIRVQNPVGLAAWVLRGQPQWTVDKINAAMNGDTTLQVNLDKPIPVLIIYTTAVVEPDDEVRFFADIYHYDSAMDQALASGYPYPGR